MSTPSKSVGPRRAHSTKFKKQYDSCKMPSGSTSTELTLEDKTKDDVVGEKDLGDLIQEQRI